MKRFIALGCALALVFAACAGSRDEITEEFLPDTGPTTTIGTGPVTTVTTIAPGPADIETELTALVGHVRDIRGLPLTVPPRDYRPVAEVEAGYQELHGLSRTGDEQFDGAYLKMLGVLQDGGTVADLESFCGIPGFYDPASGTLVLDERLRGDSEELTPFGRRHLIGEFVSAATDQAHGWWEAMLAHEDAGDDEAGAALRALVSGDATFHADQFVERHLGQTDRFAIRLEEIACEQGRTSPPEYVTALEDFGPGAGRDFVEALISNGGVAAVDGAYADAPATTEQIYHPARFAAGEDDIDVDLLAITASGFTEKDHGTFGERVFRAVLSDGVTSPQALQAATGWGGDAYRVLWNGSNVVLVLLYEGDESRDARELAETLGGWASASMRVGSGRPDNTGLAFEGEEYAFVAHSDTAMLLVLSNDAVAGRAIRDKYWPRW